MHLENWSCFDFKKKKNLKKRNGKRKRYFSGIANKTKRKYSSKQPLLLTATGPTNLSSFDFIKEELNTKKLINVKSRNFFL